MTTLKQLKAIPITFKYTVFGYIHQLEKKLPIYEYPCVDSLFDIGILFSW